MSIAEEPAGTCIAAFDTPEHVELWVLQNDDLVSNIPVLEGKGDLTAVVYIYNGLTFINQLFFYLLVSVLSLMFEYFLFSLQSFYMLSLQNFMCKKN